MIYLLLTVIFTVTWLTVFRLFPRYGIDTFQAVVFNYLTCVMTGMIAFQNYATTTRIVSTQGWAVYALLLGGLFISIFYITALSTQRLGLTLTGVLARTSLVMPLLFSLFILRNNTKNFDFYNYTGIITALFAIILCSIKNESRVARDSSVFTYALPILVFLGSGIVDISVNYLNWKYVRVDTSDEFSILTFMGAAAIGCIVLFSQAIFGAKSIQVKNMVAGICVGIPNFFSLYFLLLTMVAFQNDGAFLFPVFNISTILVSAAVGYLLFRERLSRLNLWGILLAIVALLLIAYQEILGI